jgi:site-specific DNA-methyltransferase (adenine-specific)
MKLFTAEGDIVLDPFMGSGTTAVAARRMNREFIGIDISQEYCSLAEERLRQQQAALADKTGEEILLLDAA